MWRCLRHDSGGISDCLHYRRKHDRLTLKGDIVMRDQPKSVRYGIPKSSMRFLLPLLLFSVFLAFGCGEKPISSVPPSEDSPPIDAAIPAAEASEPEQVPAGCAVGHRLAAGSPCKWEVADSYVEVKASAMGTLDVHVKAGACSRTVSIGPKAEISVSSASDACRSSVTYKPETSVLTASGYSVGEIGVRVSYQGGVWVVTGAPPSPR